MIVSLKSPLCGRSTAEISALTGVKQRTVNSIYARAIQRGFEPNAIPLIMKDSYFKDDPKSGRPTKRTIALKQSISTEVREERYGREFSIC